MTTRDALSPQTVPILPDVRPNRGWTGQMLEMAGHVGAYATLLIVDRFGGQRVYVPMDPATSPFTDLIGTDLAATMSQVYGREHLDIPTGRMAFAVARRAHVVAQVRSGALSVNEAAGMLRTSRTYLSRLVNQTTEGTDVDPPAVPIHADPRQMSLFEN